MDSFSCADCSKYFLNRQFGSLYENPGQTVSNGFMQQTLSSARHLQSVARVTCNSLDALLMPTSFINESAFILNSGEYRIIGSPPRMAFPQIVFRLWQQTENRLRYKCYHFVLFQRRDKNRIFLFDFYTTCLWSLSYPSFTIDHDCSGRWT